MVDELTLYWTVVTALISAGWLVASFIRDRAAQSVELSSAIMNRLLSADQLLVENPDIQKYLSGNATCGEEHFRDPAVLNDLAFFKAKAFVYRQLNSFDEILSASSKKKSRIWSFLRPPGLIERSDWERYIKEALRHPLYRSVLIREAPIFGAGLRDFWNKHKQEIESAPASPFVW
jgi:hypothetical protein